MKYLSSLVLALAFSVSALAGPVYDSFMEEFQVGAYTNPQKLDMSGIWPGGLLTTPSIDSHWQDGVRELLGNEAAHQESLTHRFLMTLEDNPFGSVETMLAAAEDLTVRLSGETDVFPVSHGLFLKKERLALGVFGQLEKGQPQEAGQMVGQLLHDSGIPLRERERFVWRLRQLQLAQLAGHAPQALALPWTEDSQLGPYDRSAVWALWVAHRRAAKLSLIPENWSSKTEAVRLAGLRKAHLTYTDLQASQFPDQFKAGLGATWFSGEELKAHLKRYPQPPTDFSAQGWWVKGSRFSQRGVTAHYEALANRPDLHSGWKMDVWRRTSEIHLLAGRWDQGLAAMDQALAIAAQDGGTRGLRRRLRHWVEQAAVLGLANDRADTAWELLDKGQATFSGEAGRVFLDETLHWRQLRTGEVEPSKDWKGPLIQKVSAGKAPDLFSAAEAQSDSKNNLRSQSAQSLWELWFKWGIALADPEPLSGPKRTRALSYREILETGLSTAEVRGQEDIALAAIAHRLAGRDELLVPYINKVVDRDVCRLAQWLTTPMPSPIPSLLSTLRKSQLDMHASLGVALATGDMRGIVAVAYELPGEGLTPEEKRRFLYPLPAEGPILEALLAADSEPALILAVARNESLFEPAVRSRAGALGWMQIMPFHFSNRGALPGKDNWAIPAVSIGLGDGLLKENRHRYDGNPYMGLAAYNAGPGAASRWLKQLGGNEERDIYLAWIGYPETRNYVEKVLIDREIYDWILDGRQSR